MTPGKTRSAGLEPAWRIRQPSAGGKPTLRAVIPPDFIHSWYEIKEIAFRKADEA